jgi:hypothetical protein
MLSEYSEKIEVHCTIPGGVLEWDFGSTRTLFFAWGLFMVLYCSVKVYECMVLCELS